MTTDIERFYWHKNPDWYFHDESSSVEFDDERLSIKPDAPERARKSFERYKQIQEYYRKILMEPEV